MATGVEFNPAEPDKNLYAKDKNIKNVFAFDKDSKPKVVGFLCFW